MPLRDAIRWSDSHPTDTPESRLGRLLESAAGVERDLWILVAAAMLVDVTLTVHGRQLGLVEVNPIARHALGGFGVLGLYGLKGVALGLGGCCRLQLDDRYGALVPLGLAVPTLVAVCINCLLIAYTLA
ncbi:MULTISPECIES: hypothetical protein [Salinibaculum]|uniref:hypothetical protein n=1 Tax=Salinibaculum TaxID=2732368 RepID=UPI0030CF65A4